MHKCTLCLNLQLLDRDHRRKDRGICVKASPHLSTDARRLSPMVSPKEWPLFTTKDIKQAHRIFPTIQRLCALPCNARRPCATHKAHEVHGARVFIGKELGINVSDHSGRPLQGRLISPSLPAQQHRPNPWASPATQHWPVRPRPQIRSGSPRTPTRPWP